MYFVHVLKGDRSVLEFIDGDYTFLNVELADYYDIPGVTGSEMRLVNLPKDSPRGGVITAGSTLLVTSGTNRTSPVKRGVSCSTTFWARPNDPPPNVPSVDAAAASIVDHEPSFAKCSNCIARIIAATSRHNLMDPIGLALDNFNALENIAKRSLDSRSTLLESWQAAKSSAA